MENMKTPLRAVALLGICGSTACAPNQPVPPAPTPAESQSLTVFDFAMGTWDWAKGETTCTGNKHRISFSKDRQEMLLTFEEPIDTATSQRIVVYRVVAAGSQLHPELPFVIRAAMEDETRTTAAGDTVVWDLIMATPNRYHWHRTDWPQMGITGAVVRCDENRPLEDWQMPAEPSVPSDPGGF
jgi:hypothetical protein